MPRGRRTEHEMEELREQWKRLMYDPEFSDLSKIKQAERLGVSPQTLEGWYEKASPAYWENRASTMRKAYSRYMPEIDMANIKAAKGGNVAAQELFYKRHEGWSPKQTNENINKGAEFEGKTDEEILLERLRKTDPALLEKVLGEKKAPGEVVEPPKIENG